MEKIGVPGATFCPSRTNDWLIRPAKGEAISAYWDGIALMFQIDDIGSQAGENWGLPADENRVALLADRFWVVVSLLSRLASCQAGDC